jgi:Xaa-Pro aminopeptidase
VTYCRETSQLGEPVVPLLLGYDVVMPTVILLARDGRSLVITGRHDAPLARELGVYDDVVGYDFDEPFVDDLRAFVTGIDPDTIAVNYAEQLHGHVADGLTHGLYRRLRSMLSGTGYEDRLVGAYDLVVTLRGVKSPVERERMRRAGERTEALLAEAADRWDPTWSEADLRAYLHRRMDEEDLGTAWSSAYCPGINTGPDPEIGRTLAGDRTLAAGELLHVDFGVTVRGYATDLQRVYYRPGDDGSVPGDLERAFRDARDAIEAARAVLAPGVPGYEVDAASRETLVDRGWPEPHYGVGHNVGRNAHDGGTLLGPRWHHFGAAVEREVREGEIYALELGMQTDWGFLGQEEVVEVTADGASYLVDPQTAIRTL